MNREERRELKKKGINDETIKKLDMYDKPCTILEVVKLGRAIAEDVANEYLEEFRRQSTSTIVALTLHVELMKDILIESGAITLEEFQKRYEERAKEFEDKQREYLNAMKEAEAQHLQDAENASEPVSEKSNVVQFSPKVEPVEVTIMKDEDN